MLTPDKSTISVESWRTGEYDAYCAGYTVGVRHAQFGDPLDFSDARCEVLEAERDHAAELAGGRMTVAQGAFYGGYEAGYQDWLDNASAPE